MKAFFDPTSILCVRPNECVHRMAQWGGGGESWHLEDVENSHLIVTFLYVTFFSPLSKSESAGTSSVTARIPEHTFWWLNMTPRELEVVEGRVACGVWLRMQQASPRPPTPSGSFIFNHQKVCSKEHTGSGPVWREPRSYNKLIPSY